jgi:hypothetical protein
LVADEFIKIWHISKHMNLISKQAETKEKNNFSNFINTNSSIKSSNIKNKRAFGLKCSFINKKKIDLCKEAQKCFDEAKLDNRFCVFYERIHFNEILYTCADKKNSFNNSIIMHNNQIGQIEYIIMQERRVHLLCKKISICSQPFYCEQYTNIKSNFMIGSFSRNFFFVSQHDFIHLKKLFLFNYKEKMCLVSTFCSSHLFS